MLKTLPIGHGGVRCSGLLSFHISNLIMNLIPTVIQYSYMLLTIEKMWTYDGPSRGRLVTNNTMNLMLMVLKPLALFVITQPVKDNKNAAPPFNLYKFSEEC